MNQTNYSTDSRDNGAQYRTGFLFILPLIFVIILLGNSLLLLAINSFRIRGVPDLLVGSLAVTNLLNNFGPVLISIIVFHINPNGFKGLRVDALCHFYNWMSSWLCLSASFIASLMAMDCACATLHPLYHRTKVTCVKVAKIIGCAALLAAFISTWPLLGWGHVYPHRGLCSFDFGGSFALLIATLGYIQLVVVVTSFFAVSWKMKRYEKRWGQLRSGRTLSFRNGSLEIVEIPVTQRKRSSIDNREVCKNERQRNARKISTLPEEEPGNSSRSPRKQGTSKHIKESRQFTKILGSAVLLFYVSWLPIILSITLELATRQHREILQSLSAQMSLVNSILNPWVYCGLSRPYRRAYIYVLRRMGRVFGFAQLPRENTAALGDVSSRFRTSTCRIYPDRRLDENNAGIQMQTRRADLNECLSDLCF